MKHKIKFSHQLTANDCGPACVQMICQYYGKTLKLKAIKEHLVVSKLGVSVKDIRSFLDKIGFNSVAAKLTLEDVHEMPLPAILYLSHGHFVILEKITKHREKYSFHIVDPSFGKLKLKQDEFTNKWLNGSSGLVIILEPGEEFSTNNIPISSTKNENHILKNIYKVANKNKLRFFFTFILTILVLFTHWAMPFLLKDTIDGGIIQKDFSLLWKLLLLQFAFAISYMFSQSVTEILTTKIGLDINIDLNKLYFNKILNLPISYHDTKFKSDLIEGINDQNRLNSFISFQLIGILTTLLNIIVFSGLLISQNISIFVIFILFSLFSFGYTFIFFKKRKVLDYSLFSLESENRNNIYELIMGIAEVKINSAEDTRLSNWIKSEGQLNKIKMKSTYLDFFMSDGNSFIAKLRDIGLLGFSSFLVIEDQMTLGVMMMISYVLGQLSGPFDELIRYTQNLQRTKLAHDRLVEIYNKEDEVNPHQNYKPIHIINTISLKNLSFKYNTNADQFILKNINMEIPQGAVTAIVGESGSGKSTLLKLLLGFYYPTQGSLFLGENNILDINLKEWRKKCGVIMQEGYIFSGSILENVTLSSLEPDLQRLNYALKIAELFEKVDNLPMKYHTKIGEIGISLSGGEQQRLLIARAVYKNPEFLFFDEATSSLDTLK